MYTVVNATRAERTAEYCKYLMSPRSHVADLPPSFPATYMQKKFVASIFQVVETPVSILQKAIYDLINSRVCISSTRAHAFARVDPEGG